MIPKPVTLPERIETKWIRTREDWAPSFQPHTYDNPLNSTALQVRFSQLSTGQYRVSVWGADDLGMEFDHDDRNTVANLYNTLNDYTTQHQLQEMGFKRA